MFLNRFVRKIVALATSTFLFTVSPYAQVSSLRIGMPSPTAASLGKFGDIPVSLYTGTPNISVPLFEVKGRTISLPISLSYHGSGVKVEEIIVQLKGIRGPMPVMTNKGTILSLPDAIAQVMEEHVTVTVAPTQSQTDEMAQLMASVAATSPSANPPAGGEAKPTKKESIANMGMMPGCPDCGNNLTLKEGCMSCGSCGFSRCG